MPDVDALEARIGYSFKNKNLLIKALSHSSYVNEKNFFGTESNERLEFLGDAVLETVMSEHLYNNFPDISEGGLTQLRASVVCERVLVKTARDMGLGKHLLLGRGEMKTGGSERNSILADAFEALAGAVFLDGGFSKAKKFILKFLATEVKTRHATYKTDDYKSYLQELIQRTGDDPLLYVITGESGPAHEKIFTVEIKYRDAVIGTGSGRSKKAAEQSAALDALNKSSFDD